MYAIILLAAMIPGGYADIAPRNYPLAEQSYGADFGANPPRFQSGAETAKYRNIAPKSAPKPKPSKPATDHVHYVIRHYRVK